MNHSSIPKSSRVFYGSRQCHRRRRNLRRTPTRNGSRRRRRSRCSCAVFGEIRTCELVVGVECEGLREDAGDDEGHCCIGGFAAAERRDDAWRGSDCGRHGDGFRGDGV